MICFTRLTALSYCSFFVNLLIDIAGCVWVVRPSVAIIESIGVYWDYMGEICSPLKTNRRPQAVFSSLWLRGRANGILLWPCWFVSYAIWFPFIQWTCILLYCFEDWESLKRWQKSLWRFIIGRNERPNKSIPRQVSFDCCFSFSSLSHTTSCFYARLIPQG